MRELRQRKRGALREAPPHLPTGEGKRCVHEYSTPPPLAAVTRAAAARTPPTILAGPERIESGWWDGGDMRRDYYVVQTREGQRAWAFLVPGSNDGWMLHGWFA